MLVLLALAAAVLSLVLVLLDAIAARRERRRALRFVSPRVVRNVCEQLEAAQREHPERQS